jgi:lysophospholipase L1-like esterase
LRHEIFTRSDALLQANGTLPVGLASRQLSLGSYPALAQFSPALFEASFDVVVLSIQPDLTTSLVRHRRDGYLFYPSNSESWSPVDQNWLRDEFDREELLNVGASMDNFAGIIGRIRQRSSAPILIYNVSSVVPGDAVHCYEWLGDIFATRIRRFNLGLTELSRQTGISVIDIDAVIARVGADRLKLDTVHLTPEGYRLVAEEVVRVLNDLGCLASAEVV